MKLYCTVHETVQYCTWNCILLYMKLYCTVHETVLYTEHETVLYCTWNCTVYCTWNCTVHCTWNCTVHCTWNCTVHCTWNCTVLYRNENLFGSVAAMAGIELPAYIISVFFVERWGRRSVLVFFQVYCILSINQSINLSVYISIYLSFSLSIYLSINLFYLSINLLISINSVEEEDDKTQLTTSSINQLFYLSLYLLLYLHIYLSVYLDNRRRILCIRRFCPGVPGLATALPGSGRQDGRQRRLRGRLRLHGGALPNQGISRLPR